MKKLALALTLTLTLFLCGCSAKKLIVNVDESGVAESVIIYADDAVMTLDSSTTLADYIKALNAKGDVAVEYSVSEYGMFILSVNGVANKNTSVTSGESWMVYTTLTTLDGVTYSSADYGTYVSNDITLYSSLYGADGLPMLKGYAYALVYAHWEY